MSKLQLKDLCNIKGIEDIQRWEISVSLPAPKALYINEPMELINHALDSIEYMEFTERVVPDMINPAIQETMDHYSEMLLQTIQVPAEHIYPQHMDPLREGEVPPVRFRGAATFRGRRNANDRN